VYLRVLKIPHKTMSALLLKADICSATAHVCFGPIADLIAESLHGAETRLQVAADRSGFRRF
jgi:hypothetical protein